MSSNEKQEDGNETKMEQPKILTLDDDFSLIKRVNDGDKNAFGILINRHKEKVRNLIFSTLNDINVIDDIAQEVFISVFNNLKNFRFEAQFTTWVYRITINKCNDYLRSKRAKKIFKFFEDVKDNDNISDDGPQVNVDINDLKSIVRKKINKLPQKLRIPLILREFENFSYQEIAETLNLEIGTVKSRIFRARLELKEQLKSIKEDLI